MARPRTPLRRTRTDSGASAVEYALILAGVAAGLLLVLVGLQRTVETAYRATSADIAVASTPQPGDTSAAPAPSATATTPAPSASTSTPAPSPTTATPRATATPTPTPTPSRPAGSVAVEAGEESDGVDIGWTSKSKSYSDTITPSGSGDTSIVDGELVFEPDSDTRGAVTVAWKFKDASGNWVTGTTTFWVTS